MKKVAPYLLLTCVGLALCVNSLILSSHLNVTSKVITLMSSSCVFSSVALMVLVLALQGTWSTTHRPDSLNRLATLVKKEKEILAGLKTQETTFDIDIWESLNEQDSINNNHKENHHV